MDNSSQFIIYQTEGDQTKIEVQVRLEDETVWLTQQLMADLFQISKQKRDLQNPLKRAELVARAAKKRK